MSAGDTIQCHDIADALEYMDALMRDGWDVDMEYKAGSKPVLTVKERVKE